MASTTTLTVPATSGSAAVVRATAAAVGARMGATVDDLDDLRVVASEAFTLVLGALPQGTDSGITVVLDPQGGEIAVNVSGALGASAASAPDPDGFAWTILSALLADARFDVVDDADGAARAVVSGRCRLHVPA
jgi:hypothetical protein